MEIRVKLREAFGELQNREPFLLTTESRPYLFVESDFPLIDTVVTFKNEQTEVKYRLLNVSKHGIAIPVEFIKSGTLFIKIVLLENGTQIKSWEVEPIIFKESNDIFQGLPAYEELLKRICALEESAKNNALAISELTGVVSEHNAKIAELFAIAEQ